MSSTMAVGEALENVPYGTPLVHEEEVSRKKGKLMLDQGQARRVAPWQQEVTDAEGRRRFHGAFTGGFSAGYYNTVGSKEGWTPSTFTSSRNQRAGKKEQQVYDFLDEDEKQELKKKELAQSAEFDTLGSTAAELARRTANKEYEKRPSAIPGGVPDEIVIPVARSIGIKLLMKMGWRQGLNPRANNIALPAAVNKGGGLGIDTLVGLDQGDQVEKQIDCRDEEELEIRRSAPSKRSTSGGLGKSDDCLPSFTAASQASLISQPLRFPPPVIPADFTSTHTMAAPPDVEQYLCRPEPPEVPSPDPTTTKAITGVAAFVARSGQRFEDILKQKHAGNSQFSFLFGGSSGHEFYTRKLWEEQRSLSKQGKKPLHAETRSDVVKAELVGAHRGRILGERPLPRSENHGAPLISPKDDASSFVPSEALSELTAQMNSRFTAGASDTVMKQVQEPQLETALTHSSITDDLFQNLRREEKPWRPTSLLCKRFNLVDPSFGKDPVLPKISIENQLLNTTVKLLNTSAEPSRLMLAQPSTSSTDDLGDEDIKVATVSENFIDLYKAIFSDDVDEDEDE